MSIRALFAVVAVIAVPIAVNGEEPVKPLKDPNTKRICRAHTETGSRLQQVRRCMSRQEEEAYRREINMDLSRQQGDKRGH